MSERPLVIFDGPPPASIPRRDLKEDPRFDVVVTYEIERVSIAGLKNPRLVSSAHGPIAHLMLWYPGDSRTTHQDLLAKLPASTRITMAVDPDAEAEAREIAEAAPGQVEIVIAPKHLTFSVWAEDACVVVEDTSDDETATYLVEPFDFTRYGDSIMVDLVAQASASVASTQVPLMFQGGNMLIGDEFVFVGRDYLDETIELGLGGQTPIENFPRDGSSDQIDGFVRELFRQTLDPSREFHFLEAEPGARPEGDVVVNIGGEQWLSAGVGGLGRRQPIFHIDMFVSLAGRAELDAPYRVLVGDPAAANSIMGWAPGPQDMQDEFDQVARQLQTLGFEVHRTPLPIIDMGVRFKQPVPVSVSEDQTTEVVGEVGWYHATSNNCLVQILDDHSDVWLPTYGQEEQKDLAPVDAAHKEIWEGLGFTVQQLGDFHRLARSSGALHCIKKYLSRSA